MKMVFALPGFGDQNYRRCLHQVSAVHILMSFYYLAKVDQKQVEAYVDGGYPLELAWRQKQKEAKA